MPLSELKCKGGCISDNASMLPEMCESGEMLNGHGDGEFESDFRITKFAQN